VTWKKNSSHVCPLTKSRTNLSKTVFMRLLTKLFSTSDILQLVLEVDSNFLGSESGVVKCMSTMDLAYHVPNDEAEVNSEVGGYM